MWKAGQTEPKAGEAGFTYAALLIVLVGLALGVQAAAIPTATITQRASEDELIHRGLAYVRAIESYWRADPDEPAFPPTLDALLLDPRDGETRHIRRLLPPAAGENWELLFADEGGIRGVAPVSDSVPFRQSGFPPEVVTPDGAMGYSDWQFVFDPDQSGEAPDQRTGK